MVMVVMVVMVPVVMMVVGGFCLVGMTLQFVAMFSRLLQLDGHMDDSVFPEFFPDGFFGGVGIIGGHSV